MKLAEGFFARPSILVAPELLGRRLVRRSGSSLYSVEITETGAYRGGKREGLRYAPGRIYVAIFQGGHEMLCIGTEAEDVPSVVTIRKGYPLEGIEGDLGSSAKLTKALRIDKTLDGESIAGDELYIEGKLTDPLRISFITHKMENMAENCLGYYRIL
jgi:DNA-3-methyladenine glycosylase